MGTKEKKTFAEKHPILNALLGLVMLIVMALMTLWLFQKVIETLVEGIKQVLEYFSQINSSIDAVVIVALISGAISILGVVLSSIVAKSLDYRRARREYLAQKREKPYGEYIDMIYKLQQSSKPGKDYPKEEMVEDLLRFSKQITLWGSPRVVSNWVKFREMTMKGNHGIDNLLLSEELMNDMRKDLGLPRVKKGNLLAFYINDIKEAMKKQLANKR